MRERAVEPLVYVGEYVIHHQQMRRRTCSCARNLAGPGGLNDEPGQTPRMISDTGSIADSQHLGYQITHHVRREHPVQRS